MLEQGNCQHIENLPLHIRNVFVVSADVSAEEHINIQAALQRFVDNSLSKTINFPAGTTEQEVGDAFMQAWKLGCKRNHGLHPGSGKSCPGNKSYHGKKGWYH